MLEERVLENEDVTRVQLLPKDRLAIYLAAARDVGWGVKVCFCAFPDSVEYVNDDELLVVLMRFRHDVGECAEEVHAECAFGLSAGGRHQVEEGPDEIPGLTVVEKLDPGMLALACDAGPVGDRYRVVSPQAETFVMPLVADNVPGSQAVDRKVARVVSERPVVEVRTAEVRPKLLRKPDRMVAGDGVSFVLQRVPNAAKSVGHLLCCVIAHGGTRKYVKGENTGPYPLIPGSCAEQGIPRRAEFS